MNWETIEGKWAQIKGEFKSEFSKVTDDDLLNLSGKKDQVLGKIQERYGVLKDEAEIKLNDWLKKIDRKLDTVGTEQGQAQSKPRDPDATRPIGTR